MNPPRSENRAQSLAPRQAWFLAVMAAAVIGMFAFVILPYVDRPVALSGKTVSFDLPTLGQPAGRLNLDDLRGKPVVLDFWASWCQPCREQAPQMEELARRLGSRAHVVGVATSDTQAAAEGYTREHVPEYINVFDEDSALARALSVTSLPTLVVLDGLGTVRAFTGHPQTADELLAKVEQLLP